MSILANKNKKQYKHVCANDTILAKTVKKRGIKE